MREKRGRVELDGDGISHAPRVFLRFGERRGDGRGRNRQSEGREQLLGFDLVEDRSARCDRAVTNLIHQPHVQLLRLRLWRRHLEQPFLIAPVGRQERERLHRGFRRDEIGNSTGLERAPHVAIVERAEPRAQHRLARRARDLRHRTSGVGGSDQRPLHVDRKHRIDARIGEHDTHRGCEPLGRCVAAHVDRVRAGNVLGKDGDEGILGLARKACEGNAAVGGAICRKRAGSVTVGDDGEMISARNPAGGKDSRCGEQLGIGHHPHRSRTFHRGVEHGVGRRRIGVVLLRRMLHRPAGAQHQDGLGARGGPQRRQEAARIAHLLDIEQDRVGARVLQQRVEQLAEIDVVGAAQRDDRREAQAQRAREIEHGRAHRARLRDQREPAAMRADRTQRRIEADVRADDAEGVRAEHADAQLARRGHDVALPFACLSLVARRRRKEYRCLDAGSRRVGEHARHRGAGYRDQRQLDGLADRIDRRMALAAEHFAMLRVDEMDFALELAFEQVFDDDPAK